MEKTRVIMSGYPGSGKSTLAAALADQLGFTLISKDLLLLTLYEAFQFGPGDPVSSLRTGAAAWAAFWLQARLSPRAILDTNIQWADRRQREDLQSLGGRLVEVRCDCSPELAAKRFADRSAVGHPAQRHTQLDAARLAAYAQPIGLGPLITVDTSGPVDATAVANDVRTLFNG